MVIMISYGGKVLVLSQQCPFLSTAEDKVDCFNECSFFEYEGSGEGCPFKKIKGVKNLSIKDFIDIDLKQGDDEVFEVMDDLGRDENYFHTIFTNQYL
jgi:hypothetical protein